MEIIGRISKGTKMDQIYLPKNRTGLSSGQYVLITSLDGKLTEKEEFKPFFYNIKEIEPLKLNIIKEVFAILNKINPENIIITGSFVEKGFRFNDLDILLVSEKDGDLKKIKEQVEAQIGIKTHLIQINHKTIQLGMSTDPLYSLMLSKCVSKKRIIFKTKRVIDYKLLDIQLIKSKSLPENFDILNGSEKYYLTFNIFAISLFLQNKKLTKKLVDSEIEKSFGIKVELIKDNLLEKNSFIKKYSQIYGDTFNIIMGHIK
jgi:hypothetical protein